MVSVTHNAWNGRDWQLVSLAQQPVFAQPVA
jgi:hypothetical protein